MVKLYRETVFPVLFYARQSISTLSWSLVTDFFKCTQATMLHISSLVTTYNKTFKEENLFKFLQITNGLPMKIFCLCILKNYGTVEICILKLSSTTIEEANNKVTAALCSPAKCQFYWRTHLNKGLLQDMLLIFSGSAHVKYLLIHAHLKICIVEMGGGLNASNQKVFNCKSFPYIMNIVDEMPKFPLLSYVVHHITCMVQIFNM